MEHYISNSGKYEDRLLDKYFATDSFEIQQVSMSHRILPRFMQGLEIFTEISHPSEPKFSAKNSFVLLVEKETLYIKNIEHSFY